jgi:hypothetical protein
LIEIEVRLVLWERSTFIVFFYVVLPLDVVTAFTKTDNFEVVFAIELVIVDPSEVVESNATLEVAGRVELIGSEVEVVDSPVDIGDPDSEIDESIIGSSVAMSVSPSGFVASFIPPNNYEMLSQTK